MKVHTDGASTTSGGSENQLSTDSTVLETIPLSYTQEIPSSCVCVCVRVTVCVCVCVCVRAIRLLG